jgi:hypothetical protein
MSASTATAHTPLRQAWVPGFRTQARGLASLGLNVLFQVRLGLSGIRAQDTAASPTRRRPQRCRTLGAHRLAPVRKASRHCRLTDSPARTSVVLFIHRTLHLIILRVMDFVKRNSYYGSTNIQCSSRSILRIIVCEIRNTRYEGRDTNGRLRATRCGAHSRPPPVAPLDPMEDALLPIT